METVSINSYLYYKIIREDNMFFIRQDVINGVDEDNDSDEVLFEFSDHVLTRKGDEWFLSKGKTSYD